MPKPKPAKQGRFGQERETEQDRCEKDGKGLLAYRNSPWRWMPVGERPRYEDENPDAIIVPAIHYAVRGYESAILKLVRKGLLCREAFPYDFSIMRKVSYFLPDQAMIALYELPVQTRADIVLEMCRNIHDGWIYDRAEDFFCYFIDWEFVYLPIELIGIDHLSAIFRPLEHALQDFGLEDITWDILVQAFDKQRMQ